MSTNPSPGTRPAVPEHLPGEPPLEGAAASRLLIHAASSAFFVLLALPLWPVYLVLALVHGRAPNVPRLRQVLRYLRLIVTVRPPAPGLGAYDRAFLFITALRLGLTTPLRGTGWLLDEVLYGKALRAVSIDRPLIELSAARSGSTQIARYLEEDPHLAAPSIVQCMFPFLWAWRLAPKTIGRFVTPEQVTARMMSSMPAAFRERHEADPFRTDTFEVTLFQKHCIPLSLRLGPDVLGQGFSFARTDPENPAFWDEDFMAFFDGMARRTLLDAGPAPDGTPRRLFIKGHFLPAAPALARPYPDARFLTVLREPASRIQSTINFLRETSFNLTAGGPPAWSWLGEALGEGEALYCEIEQEWFTRPDGPRRCVVRFSDYVRDLEGTMRKVYRECLDEPELPAWVPREHEPRKRHDYTYDRSLAEVGVDEAALNERLASYIAWCRGEEARS